MNYSNKIYSVLLFLFMLVACKEEYVVTPATYSLLLTGENSKTWQQTSFTFIFNDTEVGEYDANLIYGIPDCALDDEYVFLRDGKLLEVYEGNDKCNPDEDDLLYKTSWDIVNANATLFLGGGDYILSKLTDDSLVFGFRDTLAAPVNDNTFWEYPGMAKWVYKPIN